MENFIKDLAYESGKLILSSKNIVISEKTDIRNIVTDYDKKVQNLIFDSFRNEVKNIKLIGEESGLDSVPEKDPFIIVDPIDGTTNFSKGLKRSVVSIAYGENKVITNSCVYDPYLNEMFYAELGKGSYLNDEKLKRDNSVDLEHSLVCFGTCPYDLELSDSVFNLAKRVFENSLDLRRTGSAAIEICYTAANRFDLFFEMILYPWDYSAADLIVRESGGVSSSFDSKPIDITKRSSVVTGSSKAVSDFMNILKEVIK